MPDASANIAERFAYTLVSGSHDPLTRRYALTAASPCCDHSDRAQKPLSRFSWVMALQGKGWIGYPFRSLIGIGG